MILYIDTSQKEEFSLGLFNNNKNKLVLKSIKSPIGTMSEKFLTQLDKFLKGNNTSLKNLLAIIVFQGPGSYTSLRIGISIANALAWSLSIPAFGIKGKNILTKKDVEQFIKKKINPLITNQYKYINKPIKPYYSNKI